MIHLQVKHLRTFRERAIGLIGTNKPSPVFFQTRFGIHTFGMTYAIDVVILNQDNEVIKVVEALKPNRIFLWSPLFNKVLELPTGSIKTHSIKKGTKVAF